MNIDGYEVNVEPVTEFRKPMTRLKLYNPTTCTTAILWMTDEEKAALIEKLTKGDESGQA